jgi:hypothetical protein
MSKLFGALVALMLVLAACTEAADTTTTAGGDAATTTAGGDGATTTAGGGDTTTTASPAAPGGEGKLSEVMTRGSLLCGVNNAVPGFGFVDDAGEPLGFDIDSPSSGSPPFSRVRSTSWSATPPSPRVGTAVSPPPSSPRPSMTVRG